MHWPTATRLRRRLQPTPTLRSQTDESIAQAKRPAPRAQRSHACGFPSEPATSWPRLRRRLRAEGQLRQEEAEVLDGLLRRSVQTTAPRRRPGPGWYRDTVSLVAARRVSRWRVQPEPRRHLSGVLLR